MTKRIRFSPFARAGVFAAGLALAGPGALASDVPFVTAAPISAAADGARSVTVADVDGDGDMDVVSASYLDDKIAWYENTAGNGTAWTLHTISTTADGARSAFAADVDGDGDVDVVSASFLDDKIAWYENTAGNGTAWTLHTVSTAANGAISVFAADVDRDGDLDLVSASYLDDKIAWYENTAGNGSAWTLHTISTTADGAGSVFAADVDGDGDVDVLSASAVDGKLAWYENTAGNGTAWVLRTISLAAPGARSVFAADLDGDGDLDVLSASVNDDKLAWYENVAGDGSAWTLRTVSTGADGATAAFAADVDGDGDLDVLSASFNDDKIAWYRNDTLHASACFGTPLPVSTTAIGATSVFTADVDGDGDMDVFADLNSGLMWYENAAGDALTWVPHTIASGTFTNLYAVDVDHDGDVDVIASIYTTSPDQIFWYENTAGNGTAWTPHTVATAVTNSIIITSLSAADVDGDGDMDILRGTYYLVHPAGVDIESDNTGVAWYENTAGDGTSWTFHTIPPSGLDTVISIFAADVDGDGDVDVVKAARLSGLDWYEDTSGIGTTWTAHTIPSALGPGSLFVADVDGDGDLDLLVSAFESDSVAWYENTAGNGTAWVPHIISTMAGGPASVFGADADGDGDMDVFATGYSDDTVAWYENTAGNGTAWTRHTVATAVNGPRKVFASDLDGDGHVDLASTSSSSNPVAWDRNQSGQFSLAASDTAPPGVIDGELVPMLSVVATHDGRAGDGDMELSSLGLLFEQAPGDPLTSAEANAVIESLRVYRDANGNGVFDPGSDTLVLTLPTLALVNGVQVVTCADGDPNVQVAFGTPRTYFVVTELTANASQQTPNQFRVTHLGVGPSASSAEDRTYDIPLRPACPVDVSSSVVGPVTPVELQAFTVE